MTPLGLLRLARALHEAGGWLEFSGHATAALRVRDATGYLEVVARQEHQLVAAEEAERLALAGTDPGWEWIYAYGALGAGPDWERVPMPDALARAGRRNVSGRRRRPKNGR